MKLFLIKIINLYGFLQLLALSCFAQQNLPIARNIQNAYNKGTRSENGSPGKHYWQNKAVYNINVSFTPATRIIAGSEEINYTNNSPDTLKEIWFKLYPNVYMKGAQRDFAVEPGDLSNGITIEKMIIGKEEIKVEPDMIEGTNMHAMISDVLPGQSLKLSISFSYTLNMHSHQRTGMVDDSSAFIAYFFPRIAVYDDIDGWNKIPYTGSQEFYNDFCNFKVNITVPKNYVVNATGDLVNADKVLAPTIAGRLILAAKNNSVTKIIDTTDKVGNITAQNETNTFEYEANNVTDFVFATSNHYIWYATSLVVDPSTQRRTRVDAVFNPQHEDYFNVLNYASQTVSDMSYRFPAWPYPYQHETIYDGLDQMEYPMMVNDNPVKNKDQEISLTDHEIFHTMFPFYMGVNETKYGWMDEGWATIGEWIISPMIDTTFTDDYGIEKTNKGLGNEADLPIMALSTQTTDITYYLNCYPKPALGYLYVRDLLGDSLFTKALHYYIEQWHGKHPMPYDFFNCINTGSGKNLNWFWQKWFFDNGVADLAIDNVKINGNSCSVSISNKGNKPVPVDLSVNYDDGSNQKIHRSIEVWQNGNSNTTVTFNTAKKIKQILLGALYDVDINKENNLWINK